MLMRISDMNLIKFLFLVLFAITLSQFAAVGKNVVLLIGDSVDRGTVHSWCVLQGLEKIPPTAIIWAWGDSNIKYGDHTKQPSVICVNLINNNTLAALHIFGSKNGGYLYVNPRDYYAKTVPRVQLALRLFYEQIGPPDQIFFSTIL